MGERSPRPLFSPANLRISDECLLVLQGTESVSVCSWAWISRSVCCQSNYGTSASTWLEAGGIDRLTPAATGQRLRS